MKRSSYVIYRISTQGGLYGFWLLSSARPILFWTKREINILSVKYRSQVVFCINWHRSKLCSYHWQPPFPKVWDLVVKFSDSEWPDLATAKNAPIICKPSGKGEKTPLTIKILISYFFFAVKQGLVSLLPEHWFYQRGKNWSFSLISESKHIKILRIFWMFSPIWCIFIERCMTL